MRATAPRRSSRRPERRRGAGALRRRATVRRRRPTAIVAGRPDHEPTADADGLAERPACVLDADEICSMAGLTAEQLDAAAVVRRRRPVGPSGTYDEDALEIATIVEALPRRSASTPATSAAGGSPPIARRACSSR